MISGFRVLWSSNDGAVEIGLIDIRLGDGALGHYLAVLGSFFQFLLRNPCEEVRQEVGGFGFETG
jgi:hypothetical protein